MKFVHTIIWRTSAEQQLVALPSGIAVSENTEEDLSR
jgi:hypothetical protein